jgi:CubicO group peptidase (beta-lactamase class C family)
MVAGAGSSIPGSADPDVLGRVLPLIEARRVAAQICVLHRGRVVLDHAVHCRPDDLFWIFSASKPFVALLVHRLAEQGALALDDPVAQHWPQFARHGKETITLRQVLQHRSGLPVARSVVEDVAVMTSWPRSVRRLEQARLRHPPGLVPAYHYLSYGFILGELVRRVTGTPVPEVLGAEFLRPLALHDIHLGLPAGLRGRAVPLQAPGPAGRLTRAVVNRPGTRRRSFPRPASPLPRTTWPGSTRFCSRVAGGDGPRILQPETIRAAARPSSDGEIDRFLGRRIRWSQGFQLGGPHPGLVPDRPHSHPMGERSSPETFGHNGSHACLAWADPGRQLVMAYLTSLLPAGRERARHQSQVSDAVLAAVPA